MLKYILPSFFTEEVNGLEKVWILGDNFVAETYRPYFKLVNEDFYMKKNFEVLSFCSSKHNDKNTNLISTVQISLATAMNAKTYLPQFILIVLDDDIIKTVCYETEKLCAVYGTYLEWLTKTIHEMILQKKDFLPEKALRPHEPQIYWTALPNSMLFEDASLEARNKFNLCLDTAVKSYSEMCMVRIKEIWDPENSKLVSNNRMTVYGLTKYWKAIDAAFKFNVIKRDEFIIREKAKALKKNFNEVKTPPQQKTDADEMVKFFRRHKWDNDSYHWARNQGMKIGMLTPV